MYLSSSMLTFFFCLIRNKSVMQLAGERDGLEHNMNGLPNIFPFKCYDSMDDKFIGDGC